MHRHTFGITLSNGTKGEITVDMPDSTTDPAWTERVVGEPEIVLNDLAISSWTIAAQSTARKAKTLEAAQEFCDGHKHGARVQRVAKAVKVSDDLGWTNDQRAELEAQGVVFD